jgi:two-component system KDP operon response regulator KdpE
MTDGEKAGFKTPDSTMRILIIEDNKEVINVLCLIMSLCWPGATIVSSQTGSDGLRSAQEVPPDVIILDLGLPDTDGFTLLEKLRSFYGGALLILTSHGEELEKVRGLELGADDYITKPFSHIELLARIKSALRRSRSATTVITGETKYQIANIQVDDRTRIVSVGKKQAKLTPTEFHLFTYLLTNAGHVLTHQALLEYIWGDDTADRADYLKVYIQRLRNKLEADPANPALLLSERGTGYRLVIPEK